MVLLINNTIMAIAIKTIPVLKDKVASAFVAKANENTARRSTQDFSKESAKASRILSKSKI